MLRTNLSLPGNASLRERVLSGDLSTEELVALDSLSLAPSDLQEKRKAGALEAMAKVVDRADHTEHVIKYIEGVVEIEE
eukprot:4156052-Amphidinium_carterae.1